MPSNLNIKYGNKSNMPDESQQTAGNIYAAENSAGNIEMYIDTPVDTNHGTSARKRLDPRIFVGDLNDVPNPLATSNPSATTEQINAAKANNIWANYDVWIDTSGDPTGIATASTGGVGGSNGLMSAAQAEMLNELSKLKLQIVSSTYWNTTSQTNGQYNNPRNKNDTTGLAGWLTIVMPDSAVPTGQSNNYVFETIDAANGTPLASSVSGGFGS